MIKRVLSVIIMIILVGGYGYFLYLYEQEDTNEAPRIEFEASHMEMSVADDASRLLEGVSAYDREDGDLTAEIIVDSISTFDDEKNRTVRYVVFDKDNKAAEATRTISYTDYTAPKLQFTDSLIQDSITVSKINKIAGAVSCVDGDISNNVELKIGTLQDNKMILKFSVQDSTGTEENLSVSYEYDRNVYNTKICLTEYLMYLPAGQVYDFSTNISEIQQRSVDVPSLREYVVIENNVDFNTPGIYEVYYYLSDAAGTDARTKGIVVIE